jgi:hypothetical protein
MYLFCIRFLIQNLPAMYDHELYKMTFGPLTAITLQLNLVV